jgi:TatD DNase family protein
VSNPKELVTRGGGRTGAPPPAPPPLAVSALDAHCHLDLMDVDVATAVRAAKAVGIERIVTVGIDVPTSRWQVAAAEQHDDVFATVAIHPNEAHAADDESWQAIDALAAHSKVVAVGETGLDHFRTRDDGWVQQEESFRRHIAIAKRHGKALVIHDRDAHDDVLRVLDAEGAPRVVVFHCFSGDAAFARRLLPVLRRQRHLRQRAAAARRGAGRAARARAGRDGRTVLDPDALSRPAQRAVSRAADRACDRGRARRGRG